MVAEVVVAVAEVVVAVAACRHLRRPDVALDLELALHAVDQDFEVKFAHALDDGLARFVIGRDAERGIFGGQAVEGNAHLFLVGLGLSLIHISEPTRPY